MPRVRFRSHSAATTDQTADSGTVPGQRGTQEGTAPPAQSEYSRAEGRGTSDAGYPAQSEYSQTAGRRPEAQAYDEPADSRHGQRRPYFGMAGTLMVLSGFLTFFIGITGIIRGTFFNRVATYPFYFSVRSRGVLFVVIGATAFVVGVGLLLHMYWARHIATVVAVVTAIANFMFLPFYPFWSIVVLTLNVLIIWELTRERDRGRREFARLPWPDLRPGARSLDLGGERQQGRLAA